MIRLLATSNISPCLGGTMGRFDRIRALTLTGLFEP